MLCPRCQNPLDSGAAFCGNCGQQVQVGTNRPSPQSQLPAVPVAPQNLQIEQQPQLQTDNQGPSVVTSVPSEQVDTVPTPQPLNPIQQAAGSSTVSPTDHSGKAIASFVFGVLGLPGCLIPIIGIVFGVLAIVFGTLSVRSARKIFAIIGMSLAVIVLLASLFLWVRNAQELANQHQAGSSFGASSTEGPLQSIATPCYTTKIPAAMRVTRSTGSCTFSGVNTTSGEQQAVKVLRVPALTLSSLPNTAKADAANVVSAIPGGSISKESTASFAESKAYVVEIKSTDGSAGTISYVYDTTSQGNLVIVLRTQARATSDNYNLKSIESNWAWL